MISNAAGRGTELGASRTSIIVLHPPSTRPALARRADLGAHTGFFSQVRAVLRMAVGLDDEREDYECAR
jgi:hypothetical protein